MTFVHTFWSKPLQERFFGGYNNCLCAILSTYSYSFDNIKQFGHKIKLYTDKPGAELLSFLNYDEVIIVDISENESTKFAAQLKFIALQQCADEILIDGDVFLYKDAVYDIIESKKEDFVCSFFEKNDFILANENDYYTDAFKKLYSKKHVFNNVFEGIFSVPESLYDLHWPNTSLIKFNNNDLKNQYIEQYFYFKEKIKDIDFKKFWPDIFIEQYNMQHLLDTNKYTYSCIVDDYPSNVADENAKKIGFCHLGPAKQAMINYLFELLKNQNLELYQKMQKQIYKYLK